VPANGNVGVSSAAQQNAKRTGYVMSERLHLNPHPAPALANAAWLGQTR
jgi:hypothetical protein